MGDTLGDDGAEATLLPIRMLNEWAYCPRLFHLMHVQRVFADSAETIEGRGQHERARPRSRGEGIEEPAWHGEALREVSFSSVREGLIGRFDAIARAEEGALIPVEAKHSAAPEGDRPFEICGLQLSAKAWPNDQVQVGAQALLLREAGERCDEARLYYRKSRSTVSLLVDEPLLEAVRRVAVAARATALGAMPPPLVDSPKCIGCSLSAICLPDETNLLLGRQAEAPRRVVPGRSDGGGVYVITQGARVGKTSHSLSIATRDGVQAEVPIKDCEHLSVFGGVQVTSQAVALLLEEGKTISWHSQSGRCLGRTVPVRSPNLELRRRQFRAADDEVFRLRFARDLVSAKLKNQRTLLRRNMEEGSDRQGALDALEGSARRAEGAASLQELLGIEGAGARVYFAGLAALLGSDEAGALMVGRSRRPAGDPGNAAPSFGYALLMTECVAALTRVGFEPDLGFYHVAEPGRPALALDLMEPFRPLIVDSVVLRGFRTKALQRNGFAMIGPACRMGDATRRGLIRGFEQRVDELVTHPVFDYRISYRRILELEARLLGRHLEGELDRWQPLVTR